jgi:hypothetical protein
VVFLIKVDLVAFVEYLGPDCFIIFGAIVEGLEIEKMNDFCIYRPNTIVFERKNIRFIECLSSDQ